MNFDGMFFEIDDFELIGEVIGKGAFGTVQIVKNIKDNKLYAAKILNVQSEKGFKGKDQMYLLRESSILYKLHHPAIVHFFGINFQSLFNPQLLQPTILTEYLPKGSLKVILDKEKRSIADHEWTPTKKFICLLGITNAMKYLHKNGIVHRDLKPENILIDYDYYPRICDFGLARCFSSLQDLTMTGAVGTPLYMAPELFNENDQYGEKIDIYAFAIVAYEIVTSQNPYYELGDNITFFQLTSKILNGYRPQFPSNFPNKTEKLISQCWSQNPKDRPTFDAIFNKLANDYSYLEEDVDNDEIDEYILNLGEIDIIRRKNIFQFDVLKASISEMQNKESILHAACEIENIDLVRYLLSLESIDVNNLSDYNSIKDSISKLSQILKTSSIYNYDKRDTIKRAAFHVAVEKGNFEIVKLFLNNDRVDVNIKTISDMYSECKAPIHIAVENEDYEIVQLLLNNKKVDINIKTSYSYDKYEERSIIHIAVQSGNIKIAQLLLNNERVDANIRTSSLEIEKTALYIATENKNIEMIQLLLDSEKVDANIKSILKHFQEVMEKAAIHAAIEKENPKIIQLFLDNKRVDVNIKLKEYDDNYGKIRDLKEKSSLHIAVKKENFEIVKLLINNERVDINLRTYSKTNDDFPTIKEKAALHIAVKKENFEIVKLLLSNEKINVNIKSLYSNEYSQSKIVKVPIHIAIEKVNYEITQFLLSNENIDVSIEAYYYSGYSFRKEVNKSLLYLAVETKNEKIVNMLLKSSKINKNLSKNDKKQLLSMCDDQKIQELLTDCLK